MPHPPVTFDLQGLEFTGLIVHEVVRGTTRLDPAITPELSSEEAPEDTATMGFLTRQLRNGMVDGGYPAGFLSGHSSGVPALIDSLLRGPLSAQSPDAEQVRLCSQRRGTWQYLSRPVRSTTSPSGMFALCRGRLRGTPVLAVMKLESQRGLRLVRAGSGAHRVMTLEVNPDLFVGNKAKLFKGCVLDVGRWCPSHGLR